MSARETLCRHAMIHGRVQGVGYRAWVEAQATRLGLAGFVRNRREGTVEAMFCGSPEIVAEMLERCRKGPRHAHVTDIDISEPDAVLSRQYSGTFSVLPTL